MICRLPDIISLHSVLWNHMKLLHSEYFKMLQDVFEKHETIKFWYIYLMRSVISRELLIVFRNTNACLISTIKGLLREKQHPRIPRIERVIQKIQKGKEARLPKQKHDAPQNNEAIEALSCEQLNYLNTFVNMEFTSLSKLKLYFFCVISREYHQLI